MFQVVNWAYLRTCIPDSGSSGMHLLSKREREEWVAFSFQPRAD